jgi:hydrogenase maturation protease
MARVLVACVGNIFLQDDGFGVSVAAALRRRALPDDVRVEDYGIRAVHLVYELLDGYDVLVLVDTVSQQEGPPGTLYVIEPDLPPRDPDADVLPQVMLDAHDLSPGGVMSLVPTLGGSVDRILVVGCQPERVGEGIGLSPTAQAAVEPAADLVTAVVGRELAALDDRDPEMTRGGAR